MPESFGITVDVSGVRRALKELDRDIDMATRNALKSAAAAVSREEKKRVPGVSGVLKKSIKQSKVKWEALPHSFKVAVGPMGGKVNLYRGKIEAKTHFAEDA